MERIFSKDFTNLFQSLVMGACHFTVNAEVNKPGKLILGLAQFRLVDNQTHKLMVSAHVLNKTSLSKAFPCFSFVAQ